jgi:serine/threonine-protein kinase
VALAPGTRLGPYEVIAQIGAGGMGEVYRARDTKLDRDVALKILPEVFAIDGDRIARFRREAQVLASLNHPHIAAIYGFEDSGGTHALVLELVEGPTLADRIAKGAIPLDEALPIAAQIAEALEAAHEQGIIHRDLKPANIKLRADGTVKVLDFGLAKAMDPRAAISPMLTASPTITTPAQMTGVGMILGTAAYMSPEQAKGRPADKRSDLWAFGCVLYEMLTRKRAFDAEDISETMAFVLTKEPDWKALPATTPFGVQRLIRRCLEKDRKQRLADAADARLDIYEAMAAPGSQWTLTPPRAMSRRSLVLVAASLAVAAAAVGAAAAWLAMRPAPPSSRTATRFSITLPSGSFTIGVTRQPVFALSSDGSRLVYAARVGGGTQLYMRAIDQLAPLPVRGTEGATYPFFSPDGQWLGFSSEDGKLKKVPATGGAAITLCDAPVMTGAIWMPDDSIIFRSGVRQGLSKMFAAGGTPADLITPDGKTATAYAWPHALPGGKVILYSIAGVSADSAAIGALRLDTGERWVVLEGGTYPQYLPSGHLLFVRADAVMAVPFDVRTLQVRGAPVPIIEGVSTGGFGAAQLAVSATGTLAYGPAVQESGARLLVWVDRHGVIQPASTAKRNYQFPRLSPDGQRLAIRIQAAGTVGGDKGSDIWLYQFARGTLSRLTFNENDAETPVWTPDGKFVTFAATRGNPVRQILRKPADGSTGEELLAGSDRHLHLGGWSPSGDALVAMATDTGHIWLLQPRDKQPLRPFLQTQYQTRAGTISPDGRWLAYASNDSNRFEVYVQAFPGPGAKYQISSDGGAEPIWARNGRELFYRNGDKMMAVPIQTQGGRFDAGTPAALFEGHFAVSNVSGGDAWYDVSPDGQRFLMLRPEDSQSTASIVMVQDWMDELKRLVPTK